MISNIAMDCNTFLILSFIVLSGFSLALHVLFRQTEYEDELVDSSFRTLTNSFRTLFYALLGAFEPEVPKRE